MKVMHEDWDLSWIGKYGSPCPLKIACSSPPIVNGDVSCPAQSSRWGCSKNALAMSGKGPALFAIPRGGLPDKFSGFREYTGSNLRFC
jgi:hypothetical protein